MDDLIVITLYSVCERQTKMGLQQKNQLSSVRYVGTAAKQMGTPNNHNLAGDYYISQIKGEVRMYIHISDYRT